ncbi:uncharacterized protein LOC117124843 [Anneissia japonica]|uniref:uncharacterized protein LOC117124843 n=1 Tax=Anneissia japonica TaxID=1529436 RepID=UPI00142585A6|nr:uncharacterized protein LOC117124843 [Anneissia japonica]
MSPASCKFIYFLALVHIMKGNIPGLKSEVLTLINRNGDAAATYMAKIQTTTRCAQECLRLGDEVCKFTSVDKTNRSCKFSADKIDIDTLSTAVILVYEVTEREGVFIKVSRNADYEEASEGCHQLKGYLASYEQLMSAVNHFGKDVTCDQCWLISGEVTFTNDETPCQLVDPAIRCNVYPDRTTLYPCFYCYITSFISEGRDYHSASRILHLSRDGSEGYTYNEAESLCQGNYGGHLALPMEVYNASLTGVQICETAWFSNGMQGAPYHKDQEICWGNVLTGYKFSISDHYEGEYKKSAYCSLANHFVDDYPFPAHGIISVRGRETYTLTYSEASSRCLSIGGTLAKYNQMLVAHEAGYQSLYRSWLKEKYVVYSCVFYPECSPYGVENTGVKPTYKEYDAFCHVPK